MIRRRSTFALTTRHAVRAGLLLAGSLLLASYASVASAQNLGTHQDHTQLSLGVRTSLVSADGYDPYAENDVLTQGSLSLSHTVFTDGDWSVAGALGFDFGGNSSKVRGADSELDMYRFSLAPELRFHVIPRLYLLGRLGPTLSRDRVKISDEASGADLSSAGWTVGFDSALGASFEVLGKPSGSHRGVRGWLQLEFGYGWSAPREVRLEARGDDADHAPQRLTELDMPDLALRGPAVKLSVAASF